MAKTTMEKIESIKAEMQQLDNEKKKLLQQQKETDRKARTKRLIERGAILESFIPDPETFTNEQIKTISERTLGSSFGEKIISQVGGLTKIAQPKSFVSTEAEQSEG